jgi:hypothetical protein
MEAVEARHDFATSSLQRESLHDLYREAQRIRTLQERSPRTLREDGIFPLDYQKKRQSAGPRQGDDTGMMLSSVVNGLQAMASVVSDLQAPTSALGRDPKVVSRWKAWTGHQMLVSGERSVPVLALYTQRPNPDIRAVCYERDNLSDALAHSRVVRSPLSTRVCTREGSKGASAARPLN